ncbi:MAG: hypothetical protein ACP5UZ_06440 [Thermoplasmata archaeon]
MNEEKSGFIKLSIESHLSQSIGKEVLRERVTDRKVNEVNGWKISLEFDNSNLGNYLCHIFSSPNVSARKGKFGLKSPMIAWWEIHQFIPTKAHSNDKGDVKVGTMPNRGRCFHRFKKESTQFYCRFIRGSKELDDNRGYESYTE